MANNNAWNNQVVRNFTDVNGNILFGFGVTANAVNFVQVANQAAGNAPSINVAGSDSNIQLIINGKGVSGVVTQASTSGAAVGTGYTGNVMNSNIGSGSPITLSNNTAANVTSLSLTAGNWFVFGNVTFITNTGTSSAAQGWLNSTSATTPDSSLYAQSTSFSTASNDGFSVPSQTFSSSSALTVYLSVLALFTSGLKVCGNLTAIRLP